MENWSRKKPKAATSSPKKLSRETVRFVAYFWPSATMHCAYL
ncbi:hypothetical protein GAGA_3166 [Paraglaciecola agarilytica NO2]|uniref:Uncharacterized protein n=1 Tax=Paraglaciecola agarilytica NO2 TaxID=1125747 RepID=A0ABQ0I9I5_9ALTE|nr:hypothetical protein GAGA_3166 [Paraglaciecola agarilytica NO2]